MLSQGEDIALLNVDFFLAAFEILECRNLFKFLPSHPKYLNQNWIFLLIIKFRKMKVIFAHYLDSICTFLQHLKIYILPRPAKTNIELNRKYVDRIRLKPY